MNAAPSVSRRAQPAGAEPDTPSSATLARLKDYVWFAAALLLMVVAKAIQLQT